MDFFLNKHRPLRNTIALSFSLFVIVACQWSGRGKSTLSNSKANLSTNTTTASLMAPRNSSGFTDDDFAKHIQALKSEIRKKLPRDGSGRPQTDFSFVIQRPFVV